jgi:hypothetical protein
MPALELSHHRAFYIHNFAPHSSPTGLYRETNLKRWKDGAGDIYHHVNRHAYPIPTLGWAKSIERVLSFGESRGIFGLGRWGQWQYFNSDVCVHEAMRLAEKLGHMGWQAAAA